MPFCGAFLASRTWGFWFPCSPSTFWLCEWQGQRWGSAAAGLCLPCSRGGILPAALLGLITCRIRSVLFQALHSPSGELSAFSSPPACLPMQHMKLWSTELCHLKASGFFLFPPLLGFFSGFFTKRIVF